MSTLSVYACGGTGINIAAQWLTAGASQFKNSADIVGLDTSTNNIPKTDLFDVVHMEGARGGGKEFATNYPKAVSYLENVLSKNKPGDFNIVIYSTAGATGGLIGPLLVRELLKQGVPVYCFIVGDRTSNKEHDNTAKSFKNLDNQRREFGQNIVFDYLDNGAYSNRGAANNVAVQRLDLASLFLTDSHEEADYNDVVNLLKCNLSAKTPATLCKANFYFDLVSGNKNEMDGNPVAIMSLFRNGDDITSVPGDLAYRVTGVIGKNVGPTDIKDLHLVLDHDQTVRNIQQMIMEMKDRETSAKQRFKTVEDLSDGGDDNGIEL